MTTTLNPTGRAEYIKKIGSILKLYGLFSMYEIEALINTFGEMKDFNQTGNLVTVTVLVHDSILKVNTYSSQLKCKGIFASRGCPHNQLAEHDGICGSCYDDYRAHRDEMEAQTA